VVGRSFGCGGGECEKKKSQVGSHEHTGALSSSIFVTSLFLNTYSRWYKL